ncbi:hypothetical protein YPPY60_2770, partial [Yersinia pestis PY-60]
MLPQAILWLKHGFS